jgi:hypothetical protein
VLPSLGSVAGRSVVGEGAGGDVTFAVDEIAESFLEEFIASRAPRVAFYSEDRGLVSVDDAVDVLIVDPIDGTRPAMAPLDRYRLLGSGPEFQISSICAANPALHARLVREVDAGMARLREVL